jgi:transcription initiation factor TFIID subunit 2
MILARTLDSFTERYQSYPFEKAYKLVFVDDLDCDVAHTASLSICSSRLLFPETVWEPLESTTRTLIHAVASQWIGVNVIAQRPNDHWIIVGGSWFMTELYLRELFGRNDHRFRQKLMADEIIELDNKRPPLHILGEYLSLDDGERKFMELKAYLVLSILHNRLVKQSGKNGVDRCLYRLLFNARNEKLPNGAISTETFLDICEKVGHQKLDTFFNQWVYGSGCPSFECSPTFNKKKQVIQLIIKQTQGDPSLKSEERPLAAKDFMREVKERQHNFHPHFDLPAFVGPMTIRIHEADGTPYEHIVDINSSTVKVEIPYNTKYKRLKRNRLQKERAAAAQGLDGTGEVHEDVMFYSLGDLFMTAEEAAEWKISEWSQEDETRMDQESYEWIRIDADFEWICRANINDMPSYMYVSQLQQDKDVVAQVQSIQYLALKEGHPIISSFLVKTLMDNRYFHGIRTMAAEVMATSAKEELDWIGLFHLKKAFRELFCIPGSPMTRSNDFSDRSSYLIQCAIPKAISKIKGVDGKAPMQVKQFLLDTMRYNDNRGNDYSDDHYLSCLMRCLAGSLTIDKPRSFGQDEMEYDLAEEFEFKGKAIDELGRHQRLDEWIPTYQNVYTLTALDCSFKLMTNRQIPVKPTDFLQYTRIGNADNVRVAAWDCLIRLGMFQKDGVVKYMLHEISSDPSPHFRAELLRLLNMAIGLIAIGDVFTPDKVQGQSNGGLVIERNEGPTAREAELARQSLEGALAGLKTDLESNDALKEAFERALQSTKTSTHDVAELLEICQAFIEPVDSLEIILHYPKYWKVQHLGNGQLRFYHSNQHRTKPMEALVPLALPAPPVQPAPVIQPLSQKIGLKLQLKRPKDPSLADQSMSTPATPTIPAIQAASIVQRPVQETPKVTKPVEEAAAVSKPIQEKPAVQRPVQEKPAVQRPVQEKPAAPKPVQEKPAASKPVQEKPVVPKLVQEKPAVPKPVQEKPTAPKSVQEKPTVPKPVQEKSTVPKLVQEKPTIPKSVQEKPPVPKPVQERPAIPKPAQERSATPKPVQEKPRGDRPKGDKPKSDKPKGDKPKGPKLMLKRPTQPLQKEEEIASAKVRTPVTAQPLRQPTPASTPASTPIPVAAPAPVPAVAPPTIVVPPRTPTPADTPKPNKLKKAKRSRVIKLRLSSKVLSRWPQGRSGPNPNRKRKADDNGGSARPLKRQASAEPRSSLVQVERTLPSAHAGPKLMLKMRVGRDKLPSN